MKRMAFALWLALCTVLIGGSVAVPASAHGLTPGATPRVDTYYQLIAQHSGRCLDVAGSSMGDNAYVQQWDCNGKSNQLWRISSADLGYYTIVSQSSSKCLDVSINPKGAGAIVQQYTCNGAQNQQFRFVAAPGSIANVYQMVVRHSNMCLEANNASMENGSVVQQNNCVTGSRSQLWAVR